MGVNERHVVHGKVITTGGMIDDEWECNATHKFVVIPPETARTKSAPEVWVTKVETSLRTLP